MKPIQLISQDLFDKVRSRFQNLEMGDETGAVTIDPAEARFFDFDFLYEGVNLGRVSVSLNELGSLKIYYSQGITEGQDEFSKKLWYSFLKEMRLFSMRRLLRFDTRDISKTNLDKNDFQHLATTQGPKEEDMTNIAEGRWNGRSSSKTSRAVKGTTEVIIRHHKAVEETFPGARSQRKNIKAIFIQNRDGERFKYPFIHPAGAFAMAQHVDHGGVPHDRAGKAIIRMSEQIAQLGEFQKQVKSSTLHDDALGITERAIGRLQELKAQIEALGKRHYYKSWLGELSSEEQPLMAELDPVTMEQYKAKFTQSSFNENLATLFPLIHSIMQETNSIDLEEYAAEELKSGQHKLDVDNDGDIEGDDLADLRAGKKEGFGEFEEWAEAVEQGKITDDQINSLKSALSQLPGGKLELGPEGQTAQQFFSGFGLDDADLEDKLKSAADLDSSVDATEIMKLWAQENYPELLVALGMSGTSEPTAEIPPSEPAPAEEPAPEQPVAEEKENWIHEVAKLVKSRYNAANEDVGPFNGFEGIALDVKKAISEKFGEDVGEKAEKVAKAYMEKLTTEWKQRHGQNLMGEKSEIQRLKELLGNLKSKVEEKGQGGEDFNVNIMSAEETEQGVAEGDAKKDMTGQTCEKCKKDTYQERSWNDDRNGTLQCSCGKVVDRWRKYKKKDEKNGVAEGVSELDRILKIAGLAK